MFPYHNRAKQLIKQGHLIGWELVDKWNQIENALVLHFDNHKPMPIRPHKHSEYMKILEVTNMNKNKKEISRKDYEAKIICTNCGHADGNMKDRRPCGVYSNSKWGRICELCYQENEELYVEEVQQ